MHIDYYVLSFVFQMSLVLLVLLIDVISEKSAVVITIIVVSIWISKGVEHNETFSKQYTTERALVSAQPSHTEIEGGFLFFSGVISERRMYLLREEVEQGLYKDFTVRDEVYIREDESLIDKGKFTQLFTCNTVDIYYKYLWLILWEKTVENCSLDRQEIIVPKGSVIKELKI